MGVATAQQIQLESPTGNAYDDEWTIDLEGGLVYHVIDVGYQSAGQKDHQKSHH